MRALIPIVLVALAGWFVVQPDPTWPIPEAADLGGLVVDSAPLRPADTDPGVIDVGGAPLRCNDCHALFESGERQRTPIGQHQDVVMDHGLNSNCLACHDQTDRSLFQASGGERLAFTDTVPLCASCHGPTWRDWEAGIHGRTNGYWDKTRGDPVRQTCIACHDPHAPAIGDLPAFPGPNTLRMGTAPEHREATVPTRNPLHRWRDHAPPQTSSPESTDSSTEAHEEGDHDG